MLFFLRPLLWPPAFLYGLVVRIRNLLYDLGWFSSYSPPVFSIGVGNLAVGGTGKTPMTAYLVTFFSDKKIAVVSRGYGRKTKGYREVRASDTASTVGDEIKMLFDKYAGSARFFVAEDRVAGLNSLLLDFPDVEVLLFDDVFQHRAVKPYVQVVLSAAERPFFRDFLLPAGRLREPASGLARADAFVFTKCRNEADYIRIREQANSYLEKDLKVFGCGFSLDSPLNNIGLKLEFNQKAKLLSALANNNSFEKSLNDRFDIQKRYFFGDHHAYSYSEIKYLLQEDIWPVITTEKDYVKIKSLGLTPDELARFFVVTQQLQVYGESEFQNFFQEAFKRFEKEKGSLINS